ncbi:hypothetical protein K1719_009006 [Acacia pycnantha]|nr:hypothetical protein K1719_009006 [Acacia pycnantha]
MREKTESARTEGAGGDGRGKGDGDGGGGGEFVFGSGGGNASNSSTNQDSQSGERRPISFSYREKLLSPGGLGFLVSHKKADDIVSGWKGYLAKKHVESEEGKEAAEESANDDDMGETPETRYPVLSVSSEQYTAWCKPWMNSVIIKVLGLSVPKHVLIDRVRRMWKPKQPLKIVPLSNDYYIVSFSSKEDRDCAYYEGPWMIDDHYLIVQRWRPNFNPRNADCQRKVAVWVRIPDLPMEFCTVESLGMIGNMIGKIIKIDRSTSIYDKGEFARICVEVDLQKPLLPAFTVFGEDKQLVYEGLHLVCFLCGRYGHAKATCDQWNEGDNEQSAKEQEGSTDGGKKQTTGGSNEGNTGHGVGSSQNPSTKEQVEASEEGRTSQTMAKQPQTTPSCSAGGGDHLGPQMVFHRDLRRATAGSKGSDKLKQQSGKSGIEILGVSNQAGGVTGNLKSEWVIVSSKRKKAERPKAHGKENRARPKLKAKEEGPLVDNKVAMVNSFSSLQDPVSDGNAGTPGPTSDPVGCSDAEMGINSQAQKPRQGETLIKEGGDVVMQGTHVGSDELLFANSAVDMGLGSVLGPIIINQSQ